MKTAKLKQTVYLQTKDYGCGEGYEFFIHVTDMTEFGYVTAATKDIEIEMEVPEDFDPVNSQIQALKEQKKKVEAGTQVMLNNLDEQIQSLLAIEFKE